MCPVQKIEHVYLFKLTISHSIDVYKFALFLHQREDVLADHPVANPKASRVWTQDTVKMGCSAQIRLRDVLVLTGVQVTF